MWCGVTSISVLPKCFWCCVFVLTFFRRLPKCCCISYTGLDRRWKQTRPTTTTTTTLVHDSDTPYWVSVTRLEQKFGPRVSKPSVIKTRPMFQLGPASVRETDWRKGSSCHRLTGHRRRAPVPPALVVQSALQPVARSSWPWACTVRKFLICIFQQKFYVRANLFSRTVNHQNNS